jgi:hypothetical protein
VIPIPYSTPPNFAAGAILTEANLDTLSDDISFLANPPTCHVYNSSTISHATSGAWQALTFNSERFDTDTMHSTSANTGRITFTTAGKYDAGGNVEFAASAVAGVRGLRILLNGVTELAKILVPAVTTGSNVTTLSVRLPAPYQFAAGNYIELHAYQDTGGALNMTVVGNYAPSFGAIWRSL